MPENKKIRLSLLVVSVGLAVLLITNLVWSQRASAALEETVAELETAVPSLELETYERIRAVPNSQNAARWVQAGAGLVERSEELREPLRRLGLEPAPTLDASTRAALAAHLESQRFSLDLVSRGIEATDASLDLFYRRGVEMEVPNLVDFLHVGTLLLADAQLATDEGRMDDAVRAVDGLRTVAFALSKDPEMIVQLTAYRAEDLYADGMRALIEAGLGDQRALRRHASTAGPSHGERFRSMIGLQSGKLRELRQDLATRGGLASHLVFTLVDAPITSTIRSAIDYYGRVVQLDGATVDDLLSGRYQEELRAPSSWIPGATLVVDSSLVLVRARAAEARDQLRNLAIEVRLSALDSGVYPRDLSAFPRAAGNAITGEPITYVHTDGGGVILEIPKAAALVDRAYAELAEPRDDRLETVPFRWRLPAVGE